MMAQHTKWRLHCHWVALIVETCAGFFIFMEAQRLDAMIRLLGRFGFAGEPVKYHAWYYHSGIVGFALLILGILLSGAALLLEHQEIAGTLSGTSAPKQTPQTPTPPT